MPLTPGERIGAYEILAPLGTGGMGEVYRARDTKLGRDVAIKVLPSAFASDAARMARFEREARVLASLNHPNIAHIYGVEERALVMELVEGESPKGPMPFDDAWKVALQIADALEYAHEKGVIHRDLKPANVKVTPEGVVKLLDFGLAKAYSDQPDSASGDPALSPTVTLGATVAGTIMGTAAYMAPEQARGKTADKRADIWSWGVVLYELLTGERLFQGEDAAETLAAVIHKQPDLEKVPPQVRKLLSRCLEKDPKKRLRDIGDARAMLGEGSAATGAETAPSRSRLFVAAIAGLSLLAAGLGWIAWCATRPVEHQLVRLDVDLGSDVSLSPPDPDGRTVILSPDGTRLVYSASVGGGQPRLFTRRLDQPRATDLPGTEGATAAFFSPDGQWIGFAAAGKVAKVSVEGGAVVPLAGVNIFGGASWGEDGNIVISEPLGRGLLRVPAGGGPETALERLAKDEAGMGWPQILPGGKAVLFGSVTAAATSAGNTVQVFTFADQRRKTVAAGGASPRYLPVSDHDGYLVYTNKAIMFAVPFDLKKLEAHGTAVPVLDDVAYRTNPEGGQFAYSPSGTLIYRKGSAGTGPATFTIQWVDAAGKRQPLLAKPGGYADPKFSPDGKRLALRDVEVGGTPDIWAYDPQRDRTIRLTFGGGLYDYPAWSPDGKYAVFSLAGEGVWWTRGDGAGQPQPLIQSSGCFIVTSFAPDGKRVACFNTANLGEIWTVPIEEDSAGLKAGKPEQFFKNQFVNVLPMFSPDGRWLAYESNASGSFEVYVRPFPPPASGQGGQWQISSGGGANSTPLAWSRTGHELYYQSGDQIMAVSYTAQGDTFVAEKPRVWIAKVGGTDWDLAPDGKRIAVVTPVGEPEAPTQDHTVVFLQNFLDYLKQRVPLK